MFITSVAINIPIRPVVYHSINRHPLVVKTSVRNKTI